MNIRKVIREELDSFIPYEYYISEILNDTEQYIDKDNLGDERYLMKYTTAVYSYLTKKYIYPSDNKNEILKLIIDKIIEKYNNEIILEETDEFDWIKEVVPCSLDNPCVGMKWQVMSGDYWLPEIYTITDIDKTSEMHRHLIEIGQYENSVEQLKIVTFKEYVKEFYPFYNVEWNEEENIQVKE